MPDQPLKVMFVAGFDNRKEPWGQTVTRLLSPEGILIGITLTPWLRTPQGGGG